MLSTELFTAEQLKVRQECGGDRYDEVWDGVYLLSPLADIDGDEMQSVGNSTIDLPNQLQSAVLPLHFRLIPGDARPVIEVMHNDGRQAWRI